MENKEYSKECEGGMCESAYGSCGMCENCGRQDICGMGCRQMHGMHCGGRNFWLRWVLGVIILVIVFVAGVKVGEFKQDLRGGAYGYGMLKERGYNMMSGYGMMQQPRWDVGGDVQYRYGMMQQGVGAQKQVPPTE